MIFVGSKCGRRILAGIKALTCAFQKHGQTDRQMNIPLYSYNALTHKSGIQNRTEWLFTKSVLLLSETV